MKNENIDLLKTYLKEPEKETFPLPAAAEMIPSVKSKPALQKKDAEEKRKDLENEDYAQDIRLKKNTLDRLFWFLGAESVLIFLFTLFQATHWLGFDLEEWSFKLLLSSTIIQITYMLQMAIKYLFPVKVK